MASITNVKTGSLSESELKRLAEIMKAQESDTSKANSQKLGKDQFLNILMTQLQHQDPMSPLEDKDFIAQMAQFSSLEQLTNMNTTMTKLSTAMETGNTTMTKMNTSIETLLAQIKTMGTNVSELNTNQKEQLAIIEAEAQTIQDLINQSKLEAAYQ